MTYQGICLILWALHTLLMYLEDVSVFADVLSIVRQFVCIEAWDKWGNGFNFELYWRISRIETKTQFGTNNVVQTVLFSVTRIFHLQNEPWFTTSCIIEYSDYLMESSLWLRSNIIQNSGWWAKPWGLSIYCCLWWSVTLQNTPWWAEVLGFIDLMLSVVQCSVTEYTMMSWGPGVYRSDVVCGAV